MSDRYAQIGFSQRIRLEWLAKTANLILAGNDKSAVNDALQEMLKDKVSIDGHAVRGNKEKAITIMMKIWLTVPRGLETLRDEGLEILQKLPQKDHIAVHWGMALATYPFWGTVAAHTGRLLRLQGTAAAAQIQRRVKEQYGERDTASRAARRVLRSFIDWEILSETQNRGVYAQGNQYSIQEPRLITWLVEASLHARINGSSTTKELLNNPSIFPFHLTYISAEHMASLSPRLKTLHHNLDDNLVMLQKDNQG
jgi:hypothetical protein